MSVSDLVRVPVVVSSVQWEEASGGFVPSGAVCGGKTFDDELVYVGRTRLVENHNELTPGVVIPSQGCLFVSFGTGVRKSKDYEVLVTNDPSSLRWIPCSIGRVPPNAVIGGIDCSYLEPLYIGKTRGNLTFGRTWRGLRFPGESLTEKTDSESTVNDSESSEVWLRDVSCSESKVSDVVAKDGDKDRLSVSFPGKVHRSHKCLYIPYNDKEYLFRNYEALALTVSPASLTVFCKCMLRDHLFMTLVDSRDDESRRRSRSQVMANTEDYVGLEKKLAQKIDLLPLPSKLRDFCKQGMESNLE